MPDKSARIFLSVTAASWSSVGANVQVAVTLPRALDLSPHHPSPCSRPPRRRHRGSAGFQATLPNMQHKPAQGAGKGEGNDIRGRGLSAIIVVPTK
jgi:hypothetical protein